jgi:hypothetical protein
MTVNNIVLDLPTPVDIKSGLVTLVSGGYVTINSQSGSIGFVSLTDDAGGTFAAIGIPNSDGASVGESLYAQAFTYGYDEITSSWNRIRTNKSGQGVLAIATSGSDYVHVQQVVETLFSSGVFKVADTVTQFPNVPSHSVTVKMTSGLSQLVWIGGSGVTSGGGYSMIPEDKEEFTTDNLNKLYGIAILSGANMTFITGSIV